jgi:hypothetical protein
MPHSPRRSLSCAFAASYLLAASPARAEPPPRNPEALYDEGRSLYETADYDGAIERWTAAYVQLEWTPANAEIKASLLYNLASAHEEAFGINADAAHLNKAMVLLERFETNIPRIYGDGSDAQAERDRVQERKRALSAKLEQTKQRGSAAVRAAEEEDGEPEPEPATAPAPPPAPSEPTPAEARPARDEPPRDRRPKTGIALLAAGGSATALGLGAGGAAIAGMILSDQANDFSSVDDMDYGARQAQLDRGRRMNRLAIAMAVTSGVLIVAGVILVASGKKQRDATRRTTWLRSTGLALRWEEGAP